LFDPVEALLLLKQTLSRWNQRPVGESIQGRQPELLDQSDSSVGLDVDLRKSSKEKTETNAANPELV
jgi:hypothetical protein